METTYLHEYVMLAQRGSFTATARELHLTQSTLSKHIAALERDFGTELFVRDRNGAKLTHAGNTLYQQALKMEELIGQTYQVVRAATHNATDRSISSHDPIRDTSLRSTSSHLRQTFGLSDAEAGALIMYMEERALTEIQEEFKLSRDQTAEILGNAYRKLGARSKQEVLDLIHSISE